VPLLLAAGLSGCDDPTELAVEPDAVDFGSVRMGAERPGSVTIRHVGGGALKSAPLVSLDSAAGAFQVVDDGCRHGGLAKGGSCRLALAFRPNRKGVVGGAITVRAVPGGAPRAAKFVGNGTIAEVKPPDTPPDTPPPSVEVVPPRAIDPFWRRAPGKEVCDALSIVHPSKVNHAGTLYIPPTSALGKRYPIGGYLQRGSFLLVDPGDRPKSAGRVIRSLNYYAAFQAADGRSGYVIDDETKPLRSVIEPAGLAGEAIPCERVSALLLPVNPSENLEIIRLRPNPSQPGAFDFLERAVFMTASASAWTPIVLHYDDYKDAADVRDHWYLFGDAGGAVRRARPDEPPASMRYAQPGFLVRFLGKERAADGAAVPRWFWGFVYGDSEEIAVPKPNSFHIQWTPRTTGDLKPFVLTDDECRGREKQRTCFVEGLTPMLEANDAEDLVKVAKDLMDSCGRTTDISFFGQVKTEVDGGGLFEWLSPVKPSAEAGVAASTSIAWPADETYRFSRFSRFVGDDIKARLEQTVACSGSKPRFTKRFEIDLRRDLGSGRTASMFKEFVTREQIDRDVMGELEKSGLKSIVVTPAKASYQTETALFQVEYNPDNERYFPIARAINLALTKNVIREQFTKIDDRERARLIALLQTHFTIWDKVISK